jgi:Leucine Rich repeat
MSLNIAYKNYFQSYLIRTYRLNPLNVQIYDTNTNNAIDPNEVTGTGLSDDTIGKELQYFSTMIKGMDDNATRTLSVYDAANNKYLAQVSKTFESSIRNRDTSVFFDACGAGPALALAEAMAVNTTITDLSLIWRSIGPLGANSLARALLVNRTLESLDLSYCNIQDEGAMYIATALTPSQTSPFNRTLTFIDLSENNISEKGKNDLKEKIEKVNEWRRANHIPEVRIEY